VSAVVSSDSIRRGVAEHPPFEWLALLGGFLAMYLPVYWWAAGSIWQSEEHGHGVIILAVLAWLFWDKRRRIDAAPREPVRIWGWALLAIGLLTYVVGRAIEVSILQFASQPLVVAAALLLARGSAALRIAWFPTIYFVFMIPLPGVLVDLITGSLKQQISAIVEQLLYVAGYPIARTGVIISIGPYQLQVADACSGLHSMFSLAALGTLFMYMVGRKGALHSAIMLASILPIAFAANIVRVIILVLVTYYLGDEAGQGFLHGTAGIVLMLVALALFFLLHRALERWLPARAADRVSHSTGAVT
jgi:exosortase B